MPSKELGAERIFRGQKNDGLFCFYFYGMKYFPCMWGIHSEMHFGK